MQKYNIKKIQLTGSPYAMGQAFGEEYRQAIHEFAQTRLKRSGLFLKTYGLVEVSEQEILTIARSLLSNHETYDLDIWQEFMGIANGAQLSPELLLVCQGYTDIRDYICLLKGHNDLSVRVPGCTAFLLPEILTKDGKVLCGQTWDMSLEAINFLVMVHKKPSTKHGIETLSFTTTGCLSLIGMNAHGIAIGNTNLLASDCIPGVHYLFTITKALQAPSISAARQIIKNTKRLAGHSFYLANQQQGYIIETTAQQYHEDRLDFFPLVQTNHYRAENLRALEMFAPAEKYWGSLFRYGKMLANLTMQRDWTIESCWRALADDQTNFWRVAICDEDFSGEHKEFATVATIIMDPANRSMKVCPLGAKSGQPETFIL